ncbi:MAG: pre-peptidase C-terminal domain-containing protein, partial [Candidatus Marinimicrobia bacterium]|nr:pre-peptidase C-terminal domain-containing protein [Candidatus Neomarinimicrobiota bacterium]
MKMNVRGWLIGLAAWALAMTAGAQYQQIVNNQTLTGLSDTAGDEKIFMVYAPTVGTLEVKTWGGTGNANLYVRHGAVPTTTVYDHRSMGATNNEEVSDPHASTGWHYIMIKAQTAYSDLNVRFRFWSELYNGQYLPVMPVAGAQASSRIFRFWVPQGQDLLRVQTGGGTGDADLYLKHDDFPTTADYDHRSFLSGNNETINVTSPAWGWWYAMVHGYTAYNGLNIVKAYAGSLSNGAVMIVGLSADANAWKFMTINVASQAQYFHVQSWGGTGNANLHVGPDLLAGSMGGWLQSAGPTNDEELRPPGPIAAGLQWIGLQGPQAFNDCRVGATYANATPQPVTFNPPGGTYAGSQSVFLSTTTPNFTIRYTTDGSDVNYGSPRYSSPIHVSATRTIKARVFSTTTVPGASYWATYTIGLTSPIFRFYSPVSGSHFYTRNQAERDHLIANLSHAWNYEGTAWHAFATQAANTTPIYRFYSPLSGSHFYTRNEAEKDHIIANLSHAWNYEGISWYAYATQAANTVPVYRFYSPVSGSHFYTRNQAERDHIIANLSHAWSYEGISYYAFAAPAG